ncbi:MAG: penicillin-binding protein activator, partial [Alphaproteobacteria bacterium]|nr:penicillin-binding protein activator [Alphaproteobacteria bacterium]
RPIPPDGSVSVAVLLPLSGPSARLGKSMLNAAEMAMFEIANDKFSLMPLDTKGTPEGAAAAAEKAIVGGAQLILGPLLASSVTAVAPLAGQAGIQVVAFSNSRAVAGEGVFIMGFVPKQQVDAIVDFAVGRGLGRYAVIAPQDPYGQTVVEALREAAQARGADVPYAQFYDPAAKDLSADVKTVADYERRRKALLAQRAMLQRQQDEVSRQALKRLENRDTIGDVEFDAILIPETGQRLRALASLLSYYDVDPPAVRVLGLRNWDEVSNPGVEPGLIGAWFAGSAPEERQRFVDRYKTTFGRKPARLASLAYDATALAAVLAQGESGPDFSYDALTNPNGFLGVDGLFRLNPNGVVERAFAILEVRKGGVQMLQQPRDSFESLTN